MDALRLRPTLSGQLRLFDDVSAPAPAGPEIGEADLRAQIDRRLAGRLGDLTLTANRSRILWVRPAAGSGSPRLDLRLDRCFVGAPAEVLDAVAAFSRSAGVSRRNRAAAAARRAALAVLREHFERHRGGPAAPPRRRSPPVDPVGRWFDLEPIRDELNRRYFEGRLTAAITWGRDGVRGGRAAWGCRRRRRSLQLGSYTFEDDLVRIHPALDRADVPAYVVETVVFHELLHAAMPPETVGGRRRVHTPEFRRREREYPDHARADRWIASHLARLLK